MRDDDECYKSNFENNLENKEGFITKPRAKNPPSGSTKMVCQRQNIEGCERSSGGPKNL
jgi:hypothetical protein